MFLGNIVSENKINIDCLFNISHNIDNINKEIPTLIIGWDFCKSIFSDLNLSILDKKINENTFWTFSKKEKRIDYEKDLKFFYEKCINSIGKNVKYRYINILTCGLNIIKNIIKKIHSNESVYIYIYNNSFIYIYVDNEIIGIDFNSIDYLNINRKKIYKILYGRNNKVFFNEEFLSIGVKEITNNNKRIIPYLYSIKNE